jgi:hypothetical protein
MDHAENTASTVKEAFTDPLPGNGRPIVEHIIHVTLWKINYSSAIRILKNVQILDLMSVH